MLAVIGVVVLVRRRLWGPLVALGGLSVAAIPSFLIGFTANRYLVDMLPALALPAAFASVTLATPARRWARRLAFAGVVAGVAWGAWVNVALATWTQQLKSPGFTAWRYEIDDALFGGRAAGIVGLTPDGDGARATASSASTGRASACTSPSRASGWRWSARRRVSAHGTFSPGRDATVLAGDTGALTLSTDDESGTAQVTWQPTDGEPVDGPLLRWDGAPLAVDVVADPVSGGFVVTVDGVVGLFAGDPPDLSTMQPSASFAESPTTTPVCDELAARR